MHQEPDIRPSQDVEAGIETPTPETTKETQPTTCQESTDSQEVRKELKELQPKNGDTEPVVAHEDLGYRTHSGRLSIRPARFGDFVQR